MNFHEIMPDDVSDVYHKLSVSRCENGFGPRYQLNATNIRNSMNGASAANIRINGMFSILYCERLEVHWKGNSKGKFL